jgi:hypothetical protein
MLIVAGWAFGDATLPAACYRGIQGAFILDLGIRGTLRYRPEPDHILSPGPASRAA